MKIKIVSDLHLEFSDKYLSLPNNGADVLVLSGDIIVGNEVEKYERFFNEISHNYKHVVYVAGNHEFYHGDFQNIIPRIKEFLKDCGLTNIHMLENEYVDIDGIHFLGGTLWTDFNNNDEASMRLSQRGMNDYRIIKNGDASKLTPLDTYAAHQETKAFIKGHVDEYSIITKGFVVVGHMAPSNRSVAPVFREDIHINGAYKSDLDYEIEIRPEIKLWTHGHMHANSDYIIGKTRVVANPRGYYRYEENRDFNPDLIVEI